MATSLATMAEFEPSPVDLEIRRLSMAGMLEIDRTCRPSRVRLPGRRS